MREMQLKNVVKKYYPTVKDPKDTSQFCPYDLEAPKALLELKSRFIKKDYGDSQIEKQKYEKNLRIAKEAGKDFYYVVWSDYHQAIYFWNVSKLTEENYDFGWMTKKCPATTDFQRREYVDKVVGGLKWGDAHRIITKSEMEVK